MDDAPSDTKDTVNDIKDLPKSSLDILNAAGDLVDDTKSAKSPTALFLEELNTRLVNILNFRNWSHPDLFTYLDPDFAAYMEFTSEPYVTSRAAFIDRYKTMCEENPGYRYECSSVNASVDEVKGAALVWFSLKIWGHPEGVEREGVYVSMWKKGKGIWICHRQNGLRGMGV